MAAVWEWPGMHCRLLVSEKKEVEKPELSASTVTLVSWRLASIGSWKVGVLQLAQWVYSNKVIMLAVSSCFITFFVIPNSILLQTPGFSHFSYFHIYSFIYLFIYLFNVKWMNVFVDVRWREWEKKDKIFPIPQYFIFYLIFFSAFKEKKIIYMIYLSNC